jgi:hypothetical protein
MVEDLDNVTLQCRGDGNYVVAQIVSEEVYCTDASHVIVNYVLPIILVTSQSLKTSYKLSLSVLTNVLTNIGLN